MQRRKYRSIPKLVKNVKSQAGRNNSGHITVRHRGGGHKKNKHQIEKPYEKNEGMVVGFEYSAQRTVPLRKTYTSSKKFAYQSRPDKLKALETLEKAKSGAISIFQPGDFVHSIELYRGQGPVVGRAAGSFCQIRSNYTTQTNYTTLDAKKNYVKVKLPSGQYRLIPSLAKACYGIPAKNNYDQQKLFKAGQNRWRGWRPSVRGVARNPVDHPHGGGQGKTSGGRPSVTFKSWPTKGQPTRNPKRKNRFILKDK